MKTSFVFVFSRLVDQDEYICLTLRLQKKSSRRLQDVLIKTNIFVLVIRLQDVFKTFSRSLQDIFKTFCYGVFKTSCKNVFKTFSRRFENVFKISSKHFQDAFKTYYQVKLFLVTHFQDVFETYSKRFWDALLRRLSTGGLPRSLFREIYGQCTKFPRVLKVSQVLVFHFTTPFSVYLQRRI